MPNFIMSSTEISELVCLLDQDVRRWLRFILCSNNNLCGNSYEHSLEKLDSLIAELKGHQDGVLNEKLTSDLAIVFAKSRFAFIQYINARQQTYAEMIQPIAHAIAPVLIFGELYLTEVAVKNYDDRGSWVEEFNNEIQDEFNRYKRIDGLIGHTPKLHEVNLIIGHERVERVEMKFLPVLFFVINGPNQNLKFAKSANWRLPFSVQNKKKNNQECKAKKKIEKIKWYQQSAFSFACKSVDLHSSNQVGLASIEEIFLAALPSWARIWSNRASKFLCTLNLQRQNLTHSFRKGYKPPRFHTGHGAKSNKRK